jgi:hypothetical protein
VTLPRRSVTVHLAGGLGNQLFQYAFGRRLSLVNDAALILDASDYRRDAKPDYETGLRICELANFAVAGTIVEDRASATPRGPGAHRPWLIRKTLKWWGILRLLPGRLLPYYLRREIVEPEANHFRFDPKVYSRSVRGAVSVRGFWQTEKYFSDIGDVIRRELVVHRQLSGKNLETANAIRDRMSVCVHVRHGDNAGPIAEKLGVLPAAYYAQAMGKLNQELPEACFFVFSDDIAWARQLLPAGPRTIYVEHNRGALSHEDLRLMSLGKHHVVANSTFGWWGAWLGKKEGQIVYAPSRYYQNIDRPNPDLYPPEWRLIPA